MMNIKILVFLDLMLCYLANSTNILDTASIFMVEERRAVAPKKKITKLYSITSTKTMVIKTTDGTCIKVIFIFLIYGVALLFLLKKYIPFSCALST